MIRRNPDRFPLFELRTARGTHVRIGPCAVTLIVRVVGAAVTLILIALYGPVFLEKGGLLLRLLGP